MISTVWSSKTAIGTMARKVEIWGVYPPPIGGISVYCKRLSEILHDIDPSVMLINFASSRSGCASVRDVRFKPWEFIRLLFVKRRIIHVQLRNVWFLTMLYLTGWRHDIVITIHNRKMLLQEGWRGRMMRRFLSHTRAIIYNDPEFTGLLVDKFGIDERLVTVLPTFIPPSDSERRGVPSDIDEFCKKHHYNISTNASNIYRNVWGDVYGFDQIIDMMDNLVNQQHMDVGLVFMLSEITDRDYYAQCMDRIASLGLTDRFLMVLGSDANGFEIWERTDLFVRATLSDMEGISVKEALQFGTPVVASDVCTRPSEAVLYRKGDASDLALKCMETLNAGARVEYHPQTDVPTRIMEIYDSIRG